DGSTDNSLSVINTFQQVKLIQTNRVKLSAARNIGAKAATGDFIVFLDADDYLLADAIEKQIYFFKYSPQAVFIIGNHLRIDDKNEPLQVRPPKELVGYAFRFLLEGNFIGMEAAVMYRKEIFDYFSFDINLHACEDYD
ncbi:glycosyltransferase, partial [Pseudomonas aeruginosa]|uniref:glycosyltransferase n=1 Tax=Pseudomonas aeruginosa TaxID=287 RepID=UPI002B404E81